MSLCAHSPFCRPRIFVKFIEQQTSDCPRLFLESSGRSRGGERGRKDSCAESGTKCLTELQLR